LRPKFGLEAEPKILVSWLGEAKILASRPRPEGQDLSQGQCYKTEAKIMASRPRPEFCPRGEKRPKFWPRKQGDIIASRSRPWHRPWQVEAKAEIFGFEAELEAKRWRPGPRTRPM